ncbi:uncharacterized protein LOC111281700 [Durio zibethinus]|uniref:Uncharacterized protein LOC111281700 n=1 Tax=Durio zibethinus TaxID=66656 RepID=A0A6P5X9M1_DURZI|nr:uncharacterized protein LOC111281700 [Durio zibethinus]
MQVEWRRRNDCSAPSLFCVFTFTPCDYKRQSQSIHLRWNSAFGKSRIHVKMQWLDGPFSFSFSFLENSEISASLKVLIIIYFIACNLEDSGESWKRFVAKLAVVMLLTIALSLIYVELKNLVLKKIFTEITKKFWSEWELRLMVIISLILQLVLVISGNLRRGYIGKKLPYVTIAAWLVYLSADWMATLVLSTLLSGDVSLKNGLIVFWTPFILWHLGSPHNITAYSLEDNELWLRHFLGMVFQVSEAIYIYIRFRSDTDLNFMAALIFIAGVFKYVERIWALRSTNEKQLINSLYPSKRKATRKGKMIRIGLSESTINRCFEGKANFSELKLLREAYSSFIVFKPLFLGLPFGLSAKFYDDMVYIKSKSAEQAFKLVGTELGYLYDLLFTKMPIHHLQPKVSLYLRAFCFLSAVSSLIAFSAIVDKSVHAKVDIVVTYLLLLGAICLDIYSFIMHAFSTWAMVRLPIPENKVHKLYSKVVAWRLNSVESKMAIKSMAQHDLINYYVKANTNKFNDAVKIIDTGNLLQKYWHTNWRAVDCELKQFIYSHLKEKRQKWVEMGCRLEDLEKLLNEKDENLLDELGIVSEDLKLDITDFTQRIFIWHFATELVYYDDVGSFRRGTVGSFCQIAKSLSDYMMYLVVVCPLMLPKGFSELINKVSYIQATKFSQERTSPKRFASVVLGLNRDFRVESYSIEVISGGIAFAQALQSVVTEHRWDHEKKWEMISKMWMEMMTHTASHCSWKEHAERLRQGGELLTHVALLMAHLGLSTQIRRYEVPDEDELDTPPFTL